MISIKKSTESVLVALAIGLVVSAFSEALAASSVSSWSSESPETREDLLRIQDQLSRILPQAQAATVAVDGSGTAGSGVIVSEDGLVLTAAHMILRSGASFRLILSNGKRVRAKTLGALRMTDAGMLKIEESGPWPFVPIAENAPKAGEWSVALGHPGGFDEERDVVVRLGRVISSRSFRRGLRTDCKIISGDSGGPLFNLNGELIGIHSRISEDIDDNFHVPVESFHRNWDKLLAGVVFPKRDYMAGGFLGVYTERHPDGIIVKKIEEGSAAAEAEIQVGDIIVEADDFPIEDPREFGLAIGSHRPREEVKLQLKRDGELVALKIRLGTRPNQ